jgi:hypothetical protein
MKEHSLTLTNSGSALIDTTDINEVITCIRGTTGTDVEPEDIVDGGEYGEVTEDQDSVTVQIYER